MSFHDATLLGIDVSWESATTIVRLATPDGEATVVASGVEDLHLSRRSPWGPSNAVNDLSVSPSGVTIEMQSGDVITIAVRSVAAPSQ